MNIKIKNNGYLILNNFKIKCLLGKRGIKTKKKEGDNITPKGTFSIGTLYYRKDRVNKFKTSLKKKIIKKTMGWCHDPKSTFYNKEVFFTSKKFCERIYRSDKKYDLLLVIKYNIQPTIPGKGSAIFLHLTSNFKKKTSGCIAITNKNFYKILKYINPKSKIKIG